MNNRVCESCGSEITERPDGGGIMPDLECNCKTYTALYDPQGNLRYTSKRKLATQMETAPDISVEYCPVCGSEDIHETEHSHGDRFRCESCNLMNPYNIELSYTPAYGEFK